MVSFRDLQERCSQSVTIWTSRTINAAGIHEMLDFRPDDLL
jgi:hypothetical protein